MAYNIIDDYKNNKIKKFEDKTRAVINQMTNERKDLVKQFWQTNNSDEAKKIINNPLVSTGDFFNDNERINLTNNSIRNYDTYINKTDLIADKIHNTGLSDRDVSMMKNSTLFNSQMNNYSAALHNSDFSAGHMAVQDLIKSNYGNLAYEALRNENFRNAYDFSNNSNFSEINLYKNGTTSSYLDNNYNYNNNYNKNNNLFNLNSSFSSINSYQPSIYNKLSNINIENFHAKSELDRISYNNKLQYQKELAEEEKADIRRTESMASLSYLTRYNPLNMMGNDTDLRSGFKSTVNAANYGLKVAKDAITTAQTRRIMSNQGDFTILNRELSAYGISSIDLLPTISSSEFKYNMDMMAKEMGYSSIIWNTKSLQNGVAYGLLPGNNNGKTRKVELNLDRITMNPTGFTETTAKNYFKAFADTHYAKQQNAIANTKRINQLIDNVSKYKRMDLKRMNSAEIMKQLKLLNSGKGRSKFEAFALTEHEKKIVAMIAATKKIDETVLSSQAAHKGSKSFYKRNAKKMVQGTELAEGYTQTVKGVKLMKKVTSAPTNAYQKHHTKHKRTLERQMNSKNSRRAGKAKENFEKLYGKNGSYTLKQKKRQERKENSIKNKIRNRKTSMKASAKMNTHKILAPIKVRANNSKLARMTRNFKKHLISAFKSLAKAMISLVTSVVINVLPIFLVVFLLIGIFASFTQSCTTMKVDDPTEAQLDDSQKKIFNTLNNNHNLNYGQIAGIMANMSHDSQNSPFGGTDNTFGLGSWNADDLDTIIDYCESKGWGNPMDFENADKAYEAQMNYFFEKNFPNFNSSAADSKDGAKQAAEDYYHTFINQNDDGTLNDRKTEAEKIYDQIMTWTGGTNQDSPSVDGNGVKRLNGTFIWPTDSDRITSNWLDTEDRNKPHQGIDIGAVNPGVKGDSIYSVYDGKVILAANSKSTGNWIMVQHESVGYTSVYMHLDEILVSVGQEVKQGDIIGKMGTTGQSTGVHLHFAIKKNGVYVNPWNAE